jgi:hypothetical protein
VSTDFGDNWSYYTFPTGGNYSTLITAKLDGIIFYFGQNGVATTFDTATKLIISEKINNLGNGIAIDDGLHLVFFIGENSTRMDLYDTHILRWTTLDISTGKSNFGATVADNKVIIAGKMTLSD